MRCGGRIHFPQRVVFESEEWFEILGRLGNTSRGWMRPYLLRNFHFPYGGAGRTETKIDQLFAAQETYDHYAHVSLDEGCI
jgi:hypothetical protein